VCVCVSVFSTARAQDIEIPPLAFLLTGLPSNLLEGFPPASTLHADFLDGADCSGIAGLLMFSA
jgi:hypothetical protein